MKKQFKILLLTDIILLSVFVISLIFGTYVKSVLGSMFFVLYSAVLLVASFIILIVTLVLGIIEYIKEKEKSNKKKILILLLTMILINICIPGGVILFNTIKTNNDERILNDKEDEYNSLANNIIEKIKNIENNKYIYLYDDLLEIDNTLKNKIDKGSYITNYENKIYVCLSDGNWTTKGYIDDYLKTTKTTESCKYEIEGTDGELYLEYYYKKNYGIKVEASSNSECGLFSCHYTDYYTIKTTNGEYKVNLKTEDNKIEVVNDFYDTLTENEKVILKLDGYIDNIDGLYNAHTNDNDESIYLYTSLDKEETLKYTKDLINFFKSEFNTDFNIIIEKIDYVENENSNFFGVDITTEYAINIVIKNGESKVYYTDDNLNNIIEFEN